MISSAYFVAPVIYDVGKKSHSGFPDSNNLHLTTGMLQQFPRKLWFCSLEPVLILTANLHLVLIIVFWLKCHLVLFS